jgi:hypothetical protein
MAACRFPPPWSVDKNACYVVRDRVGQALSYVYFKDEPGRRSAAKLLSKDEAQKIAVSIAPQLIDRIGRWVLRLRADHPAFIFPRGRSEPG